MLHLLLQLSGANGTQDSSMLQGSVIESVFTNKIKNQTTFKREGTSKPDQVMKEANDLVLSTRQRQLEYLQSLKFQSALGDVNEDVLVRDLLFVF
jgi:hypothetical protein